jgi:hypothetical protein
MPWTLPYGLHAVGNGVSLFPWRKMTGGRRTRPDPPKPMTGSPVEASRISGKSSGNVVPMTGAGPGGTALAVPTVAVTLTASTAPTRRNLPRISTPE